MKKLVFLLLLHIIALPIFSQINTDRMMRIGQNALYFEDYILSIQYFNQVIKSKPWIAEPYFYRAVAKISLDDYKGAEADCTDALERNPFLVQAYYARGIARQNLEDFDGAIADYDKGLELKYGDKQMLTNKAIANIQRKNYKEAEGVFEILMKEFPKYSTNYLTRGAMYSEEGDTARAMADYNRAIELDPYYPHAYGNRAILLYQQDRFEEALADLNEAIHLNNREPGYYINRGLVQYQLNNLRGAMADYDQVVNMESDNLIARFNRGLLRAQIGDNNRAIEDFDVVIELEPDNYMAIYNRALLNYDIGDYRSSIRDLDKVLEQYPNFVSGYYTRSEAKRKIKDAAGADKDYWYAYNLDEKLRNERKNKKTTDDTDNDDSDAVADKKTQNTREQSDKSIDKFNRLVVYDKEEERKNKYNSDIRGRVQDKNVKVDIEPMFIVTYYEKIDNVKKPLYYSKMVDECNVTSGLGMRLRLTNQEASLNQAQIDTHFNSINDYSAKIAANPMDYRGYLGRAMDLMLVQDFTEAIKDFTKVIELNPDFALAYFNRANVRYKQMEYDQSRLAADSEDETVNINTDLKYGQSRSAQTNQKTVDKASVAVKESKRAQEHEMISRDYDMVIKLNPDFIYAYFNRGNLRCAQRDFLAAIEDYTEAINREPEFAEAYFNRGLARLSQGDATNGIKDLSKAGELGIINAYSIIKRMTVN
jgi:tetratricopeptide (TPR) repeat protein